MPRFAMSSEVRSLRLASFLITVYALFAMPVGADDGGLPVTSELVRSACGGCHQADEAGRLSRISYLRKAPEGWELTLKRMMRTAGLDLSPDEARAIVRYLADHHGLAPEEERPYFYRAEKRSKLESMDDEEIGETCMRCHLGARFLTQRRTEEEWGLLKGMHMGYFPIIEFQTFRGDGDDGDTTGAESPASEWRVDRVLRKLAKAYPLETPAWKTYQAKGMSRSIEGRWLLATHQPGVGPAAGIVTIRRDGDDYVYSGEVVLADGSRRSRDGKGVLYGGYSWRGTSSGAGLGELHEVLILSDDGNSLTGRFYEGAFGELGLDVTLTRLGSDPRVAAVWPRSARVGSGRTTLEILGANLDASITAMDVGFGPGVQVTRVSSRSSELLEVEVTVGADAPAGSRDVAVGSATVLDAFAVYDRVDYVKVLPEEGLARVGGVNVPKQLAKFEAVAFQRGADGEPLTADDVNLGTLPAGQVEWSVEEYFIRNEDDDVPYVGTIDANGLFTPNREGPNPDRELQADNFGDVWVVASHRPVGASETLKGRARLVVGIPIFVYWDLFPGGP